jgi:hypothetical protein
MQNYCCTCFVWVRNLVSDVKVRVQTEGVCKQGAEGNIWTQEG